MTSIKVLRQIIPFCTLVHRKCRGCNLENSPNTVNDYAGHASPNVLISILKAFLGSDNSLVFILPFWFLDV
jgi:hypothetical protein